MQTDWQLGKDTVVLELWSPRCTAELETACSKGNGACPLIPREPVRQPYATAEPLCLSKLASRSPAATCV